MKIVRFPIQPGYILKDIPNSSTYNDNLFLQSWYNTSGKQCIDDGRQVWFNTTEDQPSYIDILQYAITNGLYVILDAHQNDNHLCAFDGSTEMTGDNFVNMWSLIATYIIKNVKNHEQVIFELYNEPVADKCQDMDPSDWNNNYVIPAIKAIKQIESANGSNPHIILATTWGNWSGIHKWNDDVYPYDPDHPDKNGDKTLPNLVSDLKKAGFTDTKSSSIVIAGHQYCDTNWSGGSNNCDPSVFNATEYNKWLTNTNKNLGDFMWFLSEGNVQCDPTTTSCNNSNLYIDFLNTISKDPKCLGFTVWYSGIAEYGNFNMSKNYNIYSRVYPVNGKNYDFSKFNTR